MIGLKPCQKQDAESLFKMASTIWHEHYPAIISTEQIQYMLDRFYSPEAIALSMDQGQQYFFICDDQGKRIGYLAVTEQKSGYWFMNKFYILQENRVKGMGTRCLKLWESLHHPQELSLQVNRKNYKSINFYFKNGFYIQAVKDFDIGDGFSMDDFIMVKKYQAIT